MSLNPHSLPGGSYYGNGSRYKVIQNLSYPENDHLSACYIHVPY
jgi:hypothetical protein